MRFFKTKEKKVKVRVKEHDRCDMCRKVIELEDSYDVFESKFVIGIGTVYPEGGDKEITSADFCQDCALKVKDLLAAAGVRMNKEEVDY